jgi:hypothetical protein
MALDTTYGGQSGDPNTPQKTQGGAPQPYTNADGVLMVPRFAPDGTLIEYVPSGTAKNPDNPPASYPGAEEGPGPGSTPGTSGPGPGQSAPGTDDHDEKKARVAQWYQQYMGRSPSDSEIMSWINSRGWGLDGIEDGIKGSGEAQTYAKAHPPATTGGAAAGPPGYDPVKLQAALKANNVPPSAQALKDFIAAHPEFATGVTIGGSKGNKLYAPGGAFLADVIGRTSSTDPNAPPYWDWDTTIGGGGGAGGTPTEIDDSYLAGYPGQPFAPPAGSDIPPPFTYQDFGPPPEAQLPGKFTYGDFVAPDAFRQPTADDVYADPSYQFRKDQAMGALQASASGKGLTNSGGTLNDLLGLSSQFASQEYGNVWDRSFRDWAAKYDTAKSTYDTNRGNAEHNYLDSLDLSQKANDDSLATYATNRGNQADIYGSQKTTANDIYNRARNEFDASVKDYYSNRDSAWDKLYKMSALGANVTTAA